MVLGRPSNYRPEMVDKAKEYRDGAYKEDELLPTLAGLAVFLKIPRSRLYEYADKNEDFQEVIEEIQAIQEKSLLRNGLSSKFNAAITKLMLHKHGYREEKGLEVTKPEFLFDEED